MALPLGLEPFVDQSRTEHALVVCGGALACLVGYAGAAAVFLGLGALDHGAPDGPRRIASVFASLACWGYYAGAFTRGKGGPVTDAVAYPLATVVVVPFAFRWTVFGPNWAGIRERVDLFFFEPALFVDAAALVVPGLAFAAALLTAWASLLGEDGVRAWTRRHLSAEFRTAFVEESDFGDDGS